ncbi:hypothetical protein Tco_0946935 [Tanacetum coccineum]
MDLSLSDNESWNDLRDFAKLVKAIALPQDVLSISDRRLIELENQVQRLMEAYLAPTRPNQVNKITTSCEICRLVSNFMVSQDARLSKFEADFKQQQSEMINKIDTVLKAITDRIAGALPSDTVKNPKLSTYPVLSARSYPSEDPDKENKKEEDNPKNIHFDPPTPPNLSITFITEKVLKFNSLFELLELVPPSSNTELICTKEEDGDVMFIEIILKDDNSRIEEPEAGEREVEYFDIFPTRSELAYHKYLMCGLTPSIFLRNPIIMEGCPSNLKIPCNIGRVHVEKAYIDLNSPLNIMTRMMYNWIMRRKLNPREDANRGVRNFTGRIKGMHVFVGNFIYIIDFMIIEDISSIIDPRLSQVVLGKPFVEISNMTHDPPEGVVRLYMTRRSLEVLRKFHWMILGGRFNQLSHVSSPSLSKPGEY